MEEERSGVPDKLEHFFEFRISFFPCKNRFMTLVSSKNTLEFSQ